MTTLEARVADSFARLADALEPLPEEAWRAPTLCTDWQVRHVVAHLTMAARHPADDFRRELAADGFDVGRTSDRLALADGDLAPDRLLADLGGHTMATFEQPGGGMLGSLAHVVIHGLDVTLPLGLGRVCSDEATRVVLDELLTATDPNPFGVRIGDQHLRADDLAWTLGDGPWDEAPAGVLVARLSGRRA